MLDDIGLALVGLALALVVLECLCHFAERHGRF